MPVPCLLNHCGLMLHILFTVISHLTIIFVITSYHFLDETVKLLNGKVVHASRRRRFGEEKEYNASLSYIASLRLVWATRDPGDPAKVSYLLFTPHPPVTEEKQKDTSSCCLKNICRQRWLAGMTAQ